MQNKNVNKQLCLSHLDYSAQEFRSKNLVPLGPWCLRELDSLDKFQELYSKESVNSLNSVQVWKNSLTLLDDIDYLRQLTLHLLPHFAKILNERHACNETPFFWRWLLSMWLAHFLHSAFEQWKRLDLIVKSTEKFDYQALEIADAHLANTSSFVVAAFSSAHLHANLATRIIAFRQKTESATLEIFNKIDTLSFNNLSDLTKNYPMPCALPLKTSKNGLKAQLLGLNSRMLHKVLPKNLLMEPTAFGLGFKELLSYPFVKASKNSLIHNDSPALREFKAGQMPSSFEAADAFESFVLEAALDYLPTVLWGKKEFAALMAENKQLLAKYAAKNVFFPAPSICVDEQSKAFLAHKSTDSAQATIIMAQHGSHYGTARKYPMPELEEYEQASIFLTWGWSELEEQVANFVPLPAIHLAKKSARGAKQNESILFVTNMRTTYNPRFSSNMAIPEQAIFALAEQIDFFKKVPEHLRSWLIHQEYPNNYGGLNALEIIKKECPWLHSSNQNFFANYQQCKLLVMDYPGTTLHTALAGGLPFVLFWDPKNELFSRQSAPLFKELLELGVLYHSAADAALALGKICINIDKWWQEPARQRAVAKLAEQYALVAPNALSKFKGLVQQLCKTSNKASSEIFTK